MSFEIRAAHTTDKDKILEVIGSYPFKWDRRIAKRYYNDYFNKSLCLKGDDVFVLTIKGNILGVIGYSLDRYETRNYWLGWFYVHKDYQGKGYGKKLLEYVIKALKNKKVNKLFVDTSSNEFYGNALTMYLDNDFRIEAVLRDYYSKGEDQIILSKTIS